MKLIPHGLVGLALLISSCVPELNGTVIHETPTPSPTTVPEATALPSPTSGVPHPVAQGPRLDVLVGGLDKPVGIVEGAGGVRYVVLRRGDVLRLGGPSPTLIARGFYNPAGILWFQGSLVLLSRGRLDALQDWNGDGEAERITPWADELASNVAPGAALAAGQDRYVFFAVGTDCSTCVGTESLRGSILVLDLKTGRIPIFASGAGELHGLAWLPGSDPTALVATAGGVDGSTGRLLLVRNGDHLGWPECGRLGPDACSDVPNTILRLEARRVPSGLLALEREGGGWWLIFGSYLPGQAGSGKVSVVGLKPDGTADGQVVDLAAGLGQPMGLAITSGAEILVADMALGKVFVLGGLPLH